MKSDLPEMTNFNKKASSNSLQNAKDGSQAKASLQSPLESNCTSKLALNQQKVVKKEVGGPKGLEPTRYGDWESKGRCYDF